MARFMFAWEHGGGLGHAGRLKPLALALRQRGHDCALQLRDLVQTRQLLATPAAEVMHEVGASESADQLSASNACSWCGKAEHEVKKLIGRSGTALCNECVSLASDIMDAELGSDWR